MEKSRVQFTNKGMSILFLAIGMIFAGAFIHSDNEFWNNYQIPMFLIMTGTMIAGFVIGIVYREEGIGKSLTKPITN